MTKKFTLTAKVMTKKEGTDGRNVNDWYWKEVAETITVTDKMESRNTWKTWYAKQQFMNKYNLTDRFSVTVTENK